jgi:hypothetical protein
VPTSPRVMPIRVLSTQCRAATALGSASARQAGPAEIAHAAGDGEWSVNKIALAQGLALPPTSVMTLASSWHAVRVVFQGQVVWLHIADAYPDANILHWASLGGTSVGSVT